MGIMAEIRKWNGVPNATGFGCDYVRDGWRVELADPKEYRWRVRSPDAVFASLTFESAVAAIKYANAIIAQGR